MLLKRFFRRILIILGGNTDNDTPSLQFLNPHLEFSKCLANTKTMSQLNTLQSVITNDTTPNGIVKVKYQALLELSLDGTHDIHHSRGDIGQRIHAENHLRTHIDIRGKHHVTP